jgi:hypothetical protein
MKQRAKVNAALCVIHDRGGDANAVTAAARTIMETGHDARTAYERALAQFSGSNPEIGGTIAKFTRLIEASCPRTIAQYDTALTQYISSGDNSALAALAPTIAADSVALAVHSGELTPEEAANGGLAQALGFEPTAEFQQAAGLANAPNTAQQSGDVPADAIGLTGEGGSRTNTGPGIVAPKAAQAWADTAYVGPLSITAAPNGLSPHNAREAARAAAATSGRAIIADDAE